MPIDPETCKITADDYTVQELTDLLMPFTIPVPVQGGCILLIQIPEDFTIASGDINRVEGWGIFGSRTDLNAEIDERERTIKIVDQCLPYSGANIDSYISISQVKNPKVVRQTQSFTIKLFDENSEGIAEIESEILYNPIAGAILDVDLYSNGAI